MLTVLHYLLANLLSKLSKSIIPTRFGGGERVRTDDLLRARQALSQLSYTPNGVRS